jgi:hypothetical protein
MDIMAQTKDFTIRQFTDQSNDCVRNSPIAFTCDEHGLEIRTEDLRKCDLLRLFKLCGHEEGGHPVITTHVNAIPLDWLSRGREAQGRRVYASRGPVHELRLQSFSPRGQSL